MYVLILLSLKYELIPLIVPPVPIPAIKTSILLSFNQTYWQRDLNTHTEGGQVTAETNELLQEGDTLGALKNATEYYSRIQDANRADIQNYIPTHTQYDYTAFNFGDSADMAKVYDFFSNGVVPYETTVNGVMADLIPALREGVDINGVIFAGANALYQAQREGRKDKEKFKEELKTQKKPENRVLSGVNQAVAGAIEATEVKKDSKGRYKHYLSDNNSKNHTLYNSNYLENGEVVVLNDGDEIVIGHTTLRFNE